MIERVSSDDVVGGYQKGQHSLYGEQFDFRLEWTA